jgi:hypothetical protein
MGSDAMVHISFSELSTMGKSGSVSDIVLMLGRAASHVFCYSARPVLDQESLVDLSCNPAIVPQSELNQRQLK